MKILNYSEVQNEKARGKSSRRAGGDEIRRGMNNPYGKYQLDIIPFEYTQTYPSTTAFASYKHMIGLINDLHHGCQYELKHLRPYKVKSKVRYVGRFEKTKNGKVIVKWR